MPHSEATYMSKFKIGLSTFYTIEVWGQFQNELWGSNFSHCTSTFLHLSNLHLLIGWLSSQPLTARVSGALILQTHKLCHQKTYWGHFRGGSLTSKSLVNGWPIIKGVNLLNIKTFGVSWKNWSLITYCEINSKIRWYKMYLALKIPTYLYRNQITITKAESSN